MEEINLYIGFVAKGVEILGILIIIFGISVAFFRYAFTFQNIHPRSFKLLRHELGKAILLGLEVLVAGDIIATVVTEPTMENVLTLGVIVLIRTFLSLSIEVEIDGRFPWQNRREK